jgi:hypothetical protein
MTVITMLVPKLVRLEDITKIFNEITECGIDSTG